MPTENGIAKLYVKPSVIQVLNGDNRVVISGLKKAARWTTQRWDGWNSVDATALTIICLPTDGPTIPSVPIMTPFQSAPASVMPGSFADRKTVKTPPFREGFSKSVTSAYLPQPQPPLLFFDCLEEEDSS